MTRLTPRWALGAFLAAATLALPARALPDPDPARVKADLDFLASPALDGRETGTWGAERAAGFLADQMGQAGLQPIQPGGFGGLTPFHFTWDYQPGVLFFHRMHAGFQGRPPGEGQASDVVGVLPGRDPALRGEYVFVTAHFDHLGDDDGVLYPGADDDASGTAGLVEVMRLLRDARPRRSIAFLAVSGEEEGLLGSEAFLARSPVPLQAIKADINLDMIGRGRPGELHVMPAKRDGYVTTLTRDARAFATDHGITLSAGIEAYWRDSDHYSFLTRSIPAICFNTGLHADYHQPSDTPDKIDYDRLTTVVKIVRDLALRTADNDAAPAPLPAREWQAWAWGPYRTPNLRPEGNPAWPWVGHADAAGTAQEAVAFP